MIKCISDVTSVTKEQASKLIAELKSHQNSIEVTLEIILYYVRKDLIYTQMYKYILERSKSIPNEADLILEKTLYDLEVNVIENRNLSINALQLINPFEADLLGLGIDLEH